MCQGLVSRALLKGALCLVLCIAGLTGGAVPVFAQPAAPVVVSPVVNQEVHSEQMYVGSVMPEKRALIGSAVDGRVVEFPLNEGDRVEAGGKLAQLLIETISEEINNAQAELELRKHELEELENGTRPEEIEQMRAQMEEAKSALKYAEDRLKRNRTLFQQKVITSEELDDLQTIATRAREVYNERVAAYELAVAGPRIEQKRQAEARVRMHEATVRKLQDQRTKHTMISRFAGYIIAEHTEEGAWVNRGDPVAEVAALDRVDILVNVLESHVVHLELGETVRVAIPALSGDSPSFEGKVVHIVPQADTRSRTFPVKVQVENRFKDGQPVIKAGMLARAFLPTGPKHKALLLAKDALVLGGEQPMVYVVDRSSPTSDEGKVRPVPVQTGAVLGALVAVTGEVKDGDLVVVLGNERLRPGQAVKITRTLKPQDLGASAAPNVAEAPAEK